MAYPVWKSENGKEWRSEGEAIAEDERKALPERSGS